MERVNEAKYLGDWLDCCGLDESVVLTVNKRKFHTLKLAQDIRKIVDDYRSNALGGLVVGLDIWEVAVVPMLLYNSETWIGVSSKTSKTLNYSNENSLESYLVQHQEPLPPHYIGKPEPS